MATELEAKIFRRRIGFSPDDTIGMPLASVTELFDQAQAEDPNTASPAVSAVIIYLEGLFVDSAKLVDFAKNQTRKDYGDIFEHIKVLLGYYTDKLELIKLGIESEEGTVRSGRHTHRQGRYALRDWTIWR